MRAGISPAEFHGSTLREVWLRVGAATWQHERQARLGLMAASLTAKLVRASPKEFRRAAGHIERELRRPIGPREPQNPEIQRELLLEWAGSLGLKVEHHAKPVSAIDG